MAIPQAHSVHLHSPVQGRREWAAQSLRQAHAQGGLTLLVDGYAGMGKTFLLRELAAAAINDGRWHVTVVRADEFEAGEPYSFIERIVAASQVDDWHFEPGTLTSPIPVARECIRRLVNDNRSHGRVIIVDDAQWVDAESHRVLRYLIPRITRRNMLLAFGVRSPHEPGSFGEFLGDLVADSLLDQRLHIQPLTAPEVAGLIADQYGVAVSTTIAQRIVDDTAGSFLEIDSILSSLTESEIAQIHLGWNSPTRDASGEHNPLLRQFKELDQHTQATVELISLAGHELTVREIQEAANILGEPVCLDEGIATGILSESQYDATIMTRHALLAKAIANSLTRERSRELFQALAAVTGGYRSLRHRLMSAMQWDESLSDEVHEYVDSALAERKFGIASEVLRASLELVTEPSARMELIESLVLVHLQAKTGYLVLDLLEEIESFPPSLLHQFMYHVLAAHRVGQEVSRAAVQEILTATPSSVDDRAILAFYSFMVVILSMRTADVAAVPTLIDHAKQLINLGPEDAAELADSRLGWMVARDSYLLVLDCYRMVQAQQQLQLDEVAEVLPALVQRIQLLDDSPLKVDAMVAVAGAQIALGKADQARSMAERGVKLLERVGEPWAAGTARVILGHCMVLQGEFHSAIELMELTEEVTYSSLDVETRSSWAALRLTMAAITGEGNAEIYVEQARRHREIAWEGYSPDLGVVAECEFARARGDMESVLALTSGEWVKRLRSTQHGFLTYRAHALIDTERLGEAADLIDQLSKWRGTRWQEYWGTLDWLRARLAQAEHNDESAKWHYDAAIQSGNFPLPFGLTLADFGRFLIKTGQIDEGTQMLRSAIQVLENFGADGYLSPIREILKSLAGDTPTALDNRSLLSTLTDRERQVVEHLVKGRSNNQIAESFVVSVATVRSHISNILRKLGLTSRGEVARLFRGQAAEDHSAAQ